MYEIKYETMNPVEQIWEEFNWTIFFAILGRKLKENLTGVY
jgi:hypothetical protein